MLTKLDQAKNRHANVGKENERERERRETLLLRVSEFKTTIGLGSLVALRNLIFVTNLQTNI